MAAAKSKALVVRAYTDRVDGRVHLKGETVELSPERLAELTEGGFVEAEQPAPKAAKTAKPRN